MIGQLPGVNSFVQMGTYLSITGLIIRLLLLKTVNLKSLIIIAITLLLSALIYYITKSTIPLLIFLSLVGAEGSSGKTIGKVYFLSSGLIFLLSTLLSIMGLLEDRIFVMGINRYARYSLGMTYVTIWAAYGFFSSCYHDISSEKEVEFI